MPELECLKKGWHLKHDSNQDGHHDESVDGAQHLRHEELDLVVGDEAHHHEADDGDLVPVL